jgi:hypothetical protein
MSTGTAEAPERKKKKRTNTYEAKMAVKFKNLSVGDEIATVGFSVSRDKCSIDFAEESFCGKRVKVRLLAGVGADPDQGILWDDVQHDVDGVADIKKFSVTPKLISAGCAFQISAVDVMELTKFAKREGVLLVIKVLGDAKDKAGEEEEEEEDDDEDKE